MNWSLDAIRNPWRRALASARPAALTALMTLTASLLVGCAVPYGNRVELVKPFDQDQALTLLRAGSNTISGTALLLHPYGGAATCAGHQVVLIPATAYADERMGVLYGPSHQGVAWPPAPAFQPELLGYQAASRSAICGVKGEFRFEQVADGSFYLVAVVPWRPRQSVLLLPSLAQKVSVRGGKLHTIEMKGRP